MELLTVSPEHGKFGKGAETIPHFEVFSVLFKNSV